MATVQADPQYSPREQRGWYFYDWANSAFASTVLTLFLGPYLNALAKAGAGADGLIHPFGIPVEPRSYWFYLTSTSVALQVVVLPVVGAVADYSHRKKHLLGLLAYLGAGSTLAMYFLSGSRFLLGGLLFLISNLAFGASIVVYNSFLPEIATAEQRNSVSSKGWGLGYLGGGILLTLNLLLFQRAPSLGLFEAMAVRVSLASAGAWWAVFSVIPLLALRNRQPSRRLSGVKGSIELAFTELWRTLRGLRQYPQTLTFLIAYLIYSDGIQTVITLAATFGSDELKIPMATLTQVILMVQFAAFGGSLLFNQIARFVGAKSAVAMSLVIWTAVTFSMYAVVRTVTGFWIAAAVVALVLGGSQALSRSLFSLMIPKGREAEYFSLYEISDRGTSWLGPLIFGLALQFTHSYRIAILSLTGFFVLGLLILLKVDVSRAAREAGNTA